MSAITATTFAKADAIRRALTLARITDLQLLLAKLTSANREEREDAKKDVRALVHSAAK